MTDEEKKERREQRKKERAKKARLERIAAWEKEPKVTKMTMTIEWKKSRTWGSNPQLTAEAWTTTGWKGREVFTCSGCGYDKGSTVIADAYNHFLKGELYRVSEKKMDSTRPYGIRYWKEDNTRIYEGGIGAECYRDISAFIGGKFERIATTDSVDVYIYTAK